MLLVVLKIYLLGFSLCKSVYLYAGVNCATVPFEGHSSTVYSKQCVFEGDRTVLRDNLDVSVYVYLGCNSIISC